MRDNILKLNKLAAATALSAFLLASGASFAVNLIAGPATATLPDGSAIPMWGYSCGATVSGDTATCAALNKNAAGGWSPVVITVPTGQPLTINLTNNLSFTPTGSTTPNTVPTSLVIVGQLGGGLGTPQYGPVTTHAPQVGTTWPIAGGSTTFTPPPQGPRVQSFGTEVAATGATLTSGECASGCALTWASLRPGTYLIESGTHPSIQGPMGLYGILVVTTAPAGATAGTAYPAAGSTPAVTYNAEVPLLFSEIDPIQNGAVQTALSTAGFSETKVWSGQPGGCGNPNSAVGVVNTCYPPAVNYTPLYYMINGVAFNKTNAAISLFPALPGTAAAPISGNVLVRMVNAGLRMHVPSIVGSQTGGNSTAVPPVPPSSGFALIAEDGNPLPGLPKVQSDVFMAAGKTYDVMINVPAAGGTALPVFDRELSLSGNAIERDAGMLAYISVNGTGLPLAGSLGAAVARPDTYNSLVAAQTFGVSDPSKGVIANDSNVYGVQLLTAPVNGTVTLAANGIFTYVPIGTGTTDSFTYCANGAVAAGVCLSGITATVTLAAATIENASGITCTATTYNASMATYLAVKTPGVLAGCNDAAGYPLTVNTSTVTAAGGLTVLPDANGGFTAIAPGPGTYSFAYQAQNSQGTLSAVTNMTVVFPAGSGLGVTVLDGGDKKTPITDYRWVIEEDRTFYIDPSCTTNPPPAGCPSAGSGIVPTLGVNFHTSYMPYVAQGCTGPLSCEAGQTVIDPKTGSHVKTVCDISNGVCRPDLTGSGMTPVLPSQVALDPAKRYYISILPGDAANPFGAGYTGTPDCSKTGMAAGHCGHGMGGAPIGATCQTSGTTTTCVAPLTGATCTPTAGATTCIPPVTVLAQPAPYQPGKLSVLVFEDDFPLNGEQDGGGGVDVLSPQEPGLGSFQIHLWDAMAQNGDFTGQMTYDMFNQPLTNSLDGTIDPNTGLNACPITKQGQGITGMIVTCPKYEGDGKTLSPLAGQAVVNNLMPGRFGVVATPGADRIARGEEWLQTNTLDGQKAHDAFVRIGEPSYFQEFGPAGYHVMIGFANPKIISSRLKELCAGTDPSAPQYPAAASCGNTLKGTITGQRLSRTPDERLYESGSRDTYYWTQCYVSVGDPDGEDFAFAKCDAKGNFTLTGLPDGDWRITTFDQWNDQLVDGLSTPVRLGSTTSYCPGSGSSQHVCNMGNIASTQWQTNLYTRTFIDDNKDGLSQSSEAGIPFANVAVRLRDGSLENLLVTDFTGTANFNETFPLFSWYTVETDVTRYKNTGTHVVYDVGGPADQTLTTCGGSASGAGYPPCGTSTIGKNLANTAEQVSLPANLRLPGAVYCAGADCSGKTIQAPVSDPPSVCTTTNGATTCSTQLSSGRIDPPWVGGVEGWQGFPGQNNFLEFGKEPYVAGENGGIKGHVVYASTRPFDDPQMLVQTQWEPLVPHVTINLYQEGVGADGITPTLTLVDHTQTSSFDDWAQGFHTDAGGNTVPNMNCPGQGGAPGTPGGTALADLFFFSLYNQPEYLDFYNSQHGGAAPTALPYNSQFKCYDGMHNWNQLQPAPYDGMYQFPSVTATNPVTGKPTGTNCTICQANNLSATTLPTSDLYYGLPQLPPGKYVVEVVVPPGFELVKEEDKNILIGDNYIAPVTQQFGGLGNIFILPDQASVGAAYNTNNAQNPTQGLGTKPNNQIVPGFVPEPTWPCVGEARIVPDYISLFPGSKEVAPFAGATRRLCDRKEVTLGDQMGAIAKFYVFTSIHIASKFTGGITDDYTSEFDPFSPQFGEKFAPPDLPVSVRDWAGNETNRVYADHWGAYNGMTYSTWEVNPPNPTGYSPTMMVFCMNDLGPTADIRSTIVNSAGTVGPNPNFGKLGTDPLFAQGYSQFCYELPFMPGTTQYLDTPVVPTSAFAGAGYNNADCAYPDATPAIKEVDGDGIGPWVSAPGKMLTITALGDQQVPNNAYNGPSATTAPYNQKTVNRHFGFGTGAGSVALVGKNGVSHPLTNVNWSDLTITGTVPSGVPDCAIQQQAQYGGSTAKCGQLVITAANGKESIDTVTVTIGGKAPTRLTTNNPLTQNGPGSIQQAIDAATPGDLIIVPAGTYSEMLLMWKPVRLQGVGAASSIINATTQPAGKLDPWRRQVNCLFGLALDGWPISGAHPYDSSGTYTCPAAMQFQVDRIPTEATIGWDATLNGNLAEMLQEPSLMGALEGAGITVLAKGANFPAGQDPFQINAGEAAFPTGTTLLTSADCTTGSGGSNPYPSSFQCNPSGIDGLGITESSQGGGAVFLHAWAHNIQIANNRITANSGTLSGGINIGQGEYPPSYTQGATNLAPGSCESSEVAGVQLPYCHNLNVNVHHNAVTLNSSTGDELFSATPAGAGGVTFCTGADYYKFNYNWICGNLSSGDGGGVAHVGFSKNGEIEHNVIVFNQSTNPTIPTNGGGIVIMGAPDVDPTCGATTDQDCLSAPGSIGPSDGIGPGLKINGNLIMGNAAESGSGGGIAFQNVNGAEVLAFPNKPGQWYEVRVTNNIIANNVAGWDGAGISLLDALKMNITNNTIASNSTTATSGTLFNTLGAPLASTQNTTNNCVKLAGGCGNTSLPEPSGLVSIQNSAVLSANMAQQVLAGVPIVCPVDNVAPNTPRKNGTCMRVSYPVLANNVFWENSAYYVGVAPFSAQYQQAVVTLFNAFTGTLPGTQTATGACVPASYWDLGVRGDTGPANHSGGVTLNPTYSVLTDAGDYPNANNLSSNPGFVTQYCDGGRIPPESGVSGWAVPPGISDASVPNPIFNLTPVATVDEGNNWVNLRWGPLTTNNPTIKGADGNYGGGLPLGDYALVSTSPAIDYVPVGQPHPSTDFFGNPRPDPTNGSAFDVGAVEFVQASVVFNVPPVFNQAP